MVLVVVADVEGDEIQRSIVRVSLKAFDEHVVLSEEMARDRMQAQTQNSSEQQIDERLVAEEIVDQKVERQSPRPVDQLERADWLGQNEHWSERVGDWEESDVEELADGRREHLGLESCGQVGVPLVDAHVFVVVAVVLFERDERRHAHGQVGDVAEDSVGDWPVGAKHQIVRDLVQTDRERVIECATDDVGQDDEFGP